MPDDGSDRVISPLYEAQHAARYERQELIKRYEAENGCRLVVVVDYISGQTPTLIEELVFDLRLDDELHVLLWSAGGDGEVAVRLVRSLCERCTRLVAVIPDIAKSAGTLFVLGADQIVMGPSSDLGPVDPQLFLPSATGGKWAAAKDIIAAVEEATAAVQQAPDTYPIHAALLADLDALDVRQARAALRRTSQLVEQALRCNTSRTEEQARALTDRLQRDLIDTPDTHAAIFGAGDAEEVGLDIRREGPASPAWNLIWRLWTRYYTLGQRVYEARQVSQVFPFQTE